MPTVCRACGKVVYNELYKTYLCKNCAKECHLACIGMDEEDFDVVTPESKQQWICPECICTKPKPLRTDPDTRIFGAHIISQKNFHPAFLLTLGGEVVRKQDKHQK